MLVPILLFLVGLLLLIKGGDWFVDGATGIARRFKMSELLIGATVVSIGTTLPEVMVSVTSAAQGSGSIAYGNAIGSIICNSALIAALTVTIRPSKVNRKQIIVPVIFFFIAAAFYLAIAYFLGEFSRPVGIVLLVLFVIYMVVTVLMAKKTAEPSISESEPTPNSEAPAELEKIRPLWYQIVLLIIGAAVIAIGADLLVDNGQIIAQKLGVPETIIALIFVALGTSLPELITAITSLIKGHSALSLGNIIGANLFNLVFVTGLSATVGPFSLPADSMIGNVPMSLILDSPVMLGVMLLLTVPTLMRGKLSRIQGIVLLCIYAAFCTLSFLL